MGIMGTNSIQKIEGDFFDHLNSWGSFLSYLKQKMLHPGTQRYAKNMGWMFFARISSMAVTFIATAYIARGLGPSNYGELSYAISFVGLFGFLASLGIDQILYRDLIRFPEKRNEYMGTAMVIRLSAAFISLAVCTLFAITLSPKDVSLILIFVISLSFIFSSFQLLGYEFQAEAKSKYPSILSLIVIIILNVAKILIVFNGNGVIYLAGIILLEPILYAIGYLYLRTREYGSVRNWRFNKTIGISILKDSFPLIFASAFFAVYARIDQVMIKNMMDAESVGLYDSAVRISELWYFLPNIIVAGLFPALMNAKKVSDELYYKRAKKLLILILAISLLAALLTTILSKYFILIIFGTGFLGALLILKIYIWSNIGAAINLLMQQLLVAENLTKIISISVFLGMATNVTLNMIWIPMYGTSGAAFASLVSYVVPFLSLFMFNKSRKLIVNIFK